MWLRDNCPCAECQDPGSGQKLRDITEIPNDLGVAASENAGESVLVTFAPDGHRSAFSRSWLAGHALDGYADSDGRTEDDKDLWLAADLAPRNPGIRPNVPRRAGPGTWTGAADRIRALEDVLRRGFVLLHDVPAEPGMVLEVAASFGFVRETNYGRLFDVRVEPDRATWPSPTGRSCRTPTTRTATRRPPCSCCTACAPQCRGIVKGEWGGGWEVGVTLA